MNFCLRLTDNGLRRYAPLLLFAYRHVAHKHNWQTFARNNYNNIIAVYIVGKIYIIVERHYTRVCV